MLLLHIVVELKRDATHFAWEKVALRAVCQKGITWLWFIMSFGFPQKIWPKKAIKQGEYMYKATNSTYERCVSTLHVLKFQML